MRTPITLMTNTRVTFSIISWFLLVLYPVAARGTTFTLSDSALMSLDYKYYGQYTVMNSITDVAGPGVQFDFLYTDPVYIRGQQPELYFTSSIYGGGGSLTGIDISSFDAFALKFTLVSAKGVQLLDAVGPLVVGALINQSQSSYAYQSQVIAYNDPYDPAIATSITTTDADQINLVGFVCTIPYWWYNQSTSPWDPDGARISLLVEPAPGAVVITPEPASVILTGAGFLFARLRRRQR